MAIYIYVYAKGRLSVESLNARLKELGGRGAFSYEGKVRRRGGHINHIWHHKRYSGGIEIGEVPESRLLWASARSAKEEERLASSLIEWVVRYFHKRIRTIELMPEYAKVARE